MNKELEEQLTKLADDLTISVKEASQIINYFQGKNETLESITIKLSGDSKTTKFSNLRFRLKDLFMSLLEGAATFPDNLENKFKVVYSVLLLIQKIRKLQVYPLSKTEAQLLVEMFRMDLDRDAISVENLSSQLGWNQEDLITHLDNLERLGCISYSMAGVKIEEVIKIA